MNADPTPEIASSICAVIVTHHPDPAVLEQSVAALAPQVDRILVVDNGSAAKTVTRLRKLPDPCRLLENGANFGIGAAQNRGMRWASGRGSSHVLLLDQDSVAEPRMVAMLVACGRRIEARTGRPAVVGPCILDPRSANRLPFVTFGRFFVRRRWCRPTAGRLEWVPTDFLIASGMLIPLAIFERVGPMDEGLFVDNTDLEWCFRARSRGVSLYGACGARLQHRLGDQVTRLNLGSGVTIFRHSPLRQYYIMRNRLVLYRRAYSPPSWILQDGIRAVLKTAFVLAVFPARWENSKMILAGFRDGLRQRQGPFSSRATGPWNRHPAGEPGKSRALGRPKDDRRA